jgi:hypothetical protein
VLRGAGEGQNITACNTPSFAAPAVRGAESEDAVIALCEREGFGRVMQIAADEWKRRDPVGALTIGPCVGLASRAAAPGECDHLGCRHDLGECERGNPANDAPGEGAEDENALVAEVRGVILAALVCQQSYSADDLARALVRRGLRRAARSSSSPSTTGGET